MHFFSYYLWAGKAVSTLDAWASVVVLFSLVTGWPEAGRRLDVYLSSTRCGKDRSTMGAVQTGSVGQEIFSAAHRLWEQSEWEYSVCVFHKTVVVSECSFCH